MVKSYSFSTVPGQDFIQRPELAYVSILNVKRSGIGYTVVDGDEPISSGERKVQHFWSSGKLKFADVFNTPSGEFGPESVFVMWKE